MADINFKQYFVQPFDSFAHLAEKLPYIEFLTYEFSKETSISDMVIIKKEDAEYLAGLFPNFFALKIIVYMQEGEVKLFMTRNIIKVFVL